MHTLVSEIDRDTSVATLDVAPAAPAPDAPPAPRWNLATRLAFRFGALYFTGYILTTQMYFSLFVLPFMGPLAPGATAPWQRLVTWVATERLGFNAPLVMQSGSGDKPYDFAQAATLLALAALGTAIWSALAWRRTAHPAVHKWFRLFLRFGLGGSFVTYGMIKAFPLQMGYPQLTRLLEPYGHFSLMGVLWAQVGASPAYQMFTGFTELLAGILLFIPGLTTLGALVGVAVAGYVWILNMTYDVPVKLFSLHLVLMSLFLLAPDMKRLFRLFVLNRAVPASSEGSLARRRGIAWALIAAQLAFGGWIVYSRFDGNRQAYQVRGPNAPKPPLYGIWTVDRMYIDGVERSPLVTDYDRWRRVVVQFAGSMSFQRMDDTFVGYGAKVDPAARTIAMTRGMAPPAGSTAPQPASIGQFTFEQPAADRLLLDGELNGKKVRMEMTLFDRESFRLVQGRFRWVQDFPFNR